MRASDAVLEALHKTIAETLTTELKRYGDGTYDKPAEVEGGEKIRVPVPAALIASTIKYLKDNGIDRPEDEEPDPSDTLADELPHFGDR